ncbi:hypothetical protein TVAG_498550 [Trichomonas vaginalis G3]|uniref:Uncharacterized protein n=1 Tax=Trichomonas vaginalis (strain ATCC PRA-98 / G3) TaxID=412133 RepID=A2E843_TRIV3|nr:hypothetical protein TVAGG3_0852560 [Trichomonas vaginalis G3]EAY11161.1 hypothetical protein TVAG_498550 [Trichomonas vaginalis G3]KAI5500102.1 hypothetical protein TVAGG3_0852560 [Trichomonas vaginalis G3]|eukprot:XP_001323384.1 hypothetical protein [Trichomonas vaginalis G3]
MSVDSNSNDGNVNNNNLNYQDSRFLRNSEIKDFLVETIKPELKEFFRPYQLPETSVLYRNIPLIISEKLTDPINVVIIFPYERYRNNVIKVLIYFYLKVSNVNNISTLIDMFSTNKFSNCIQNIKVVKYFARAKNMYSFNYYLIMPNEDLHFFFKEIDQIRPDDKLFYSFKNVHLRAEYFDLILLLSKNTDNSETIQTFIQVLPLQGKPLMIELSHIWERICNYPKKILALIVQKFTSHKNYQPIKEHND